MNTESTISRQMMRGAVVAAAVVAANLIAAEPGDIEAVSATDVVRAVPEAPAPIVGIAAPDIQVPRADDEQIVVPAIRHLEAGLPELPAIDVDAVRNTAAAWLGDGIMSAPEQVIEVASPIVDVSTMGIEATIERPVLQRPALPEPPAVR